MDLSKFAVKSQLLKTVIEKHFVHNVVRMWLLFCFVFVTHAGMAAGGGRAFSHVCLSVCFSVCLSAI